MNSFSPCLVFVWEKWFLGFGVLVVVWLGFARVFEFEEGLRKGEDAGTLSSLAYAAADVLKSAAILFILKKGLPCD